MKLSFLTIALICSSIFLSCKSAKKKNNPDPMQVIFSKTICKGVCPAYILTINDDREVVFEGQQNTKVKGTLETVLSEQEFDSLYTLVNASSFFDLEEPNTRVMDISFTNLEISLGEQKRKVRFATQIPDDIKVITTYLESIAQNIQEQAFQDIKDQN